MNLTGYKKSLKKIKETLEKEENKEHSNPSKIRQLELAKEDCSRRIKDLKPKTEIKKVVKKNVKMQ